MTDMQILAGMTELNERVQNEARATEAERQAQATQQELARSQAGVKGKEKGAAVPLQQAQGIGASGRFFGGALADFYEHIEGHSNDSATILDLALTSLRFDAGLLRNISTELYRVLIMLARGRAQRLVLKATEQEGLEAYRLLLRRFEPKSTATTVSNLVDLLATTFGGDLMDSLTDFEKRVHPGNMTRKKRCQI